MKVSEGIAEGIALMMNRYELNSDDYNAIFDGAAEAFTAYIDGHKPDGVTFDAQRCAFGGAVDRLTEPEQEQLLRAAEAAAEVR